MRITYLSFIQLPDRLLRITKKDGSITWYRPIYADGKEEIKCRIESNRYCIDEKENRRVSDFVKLIAENT